MSNTYFNLLIHVVFGVKQRRRLLSKRIQDRLYPYMAGIANKNNFKILKSGGTEDHVHILLSLCTDISVAKAVQLIKGGSSKWLRETFPELKIFCWQEGYGAFSVSLSQVEKVKRYIENQEKHHKKKTYKEEYLEFLQKNNVDFNEKYVF